MIPILHLSAMLVPAIVILILRQHCGTVKFSSRRLLFAILFGFFYLIFTAVVTSHACKSGDPGQQILFCCLCLGHIIARLQIPFSGLLTLCAALIAINLGVSMPTSKWFTELSTPATQDPPLCGRSSHCGTARSPASTLAARS